MLYLLNELTNFRNSGKAVSPMYSETILCMNNVMVQTARGINKLSLCLAICWYADNGWL